MPSLIYFGDIRGHTMSGAESAKNLLLNYNNDEYNAFRLNNNLELSLPAVSSVPGVGASKRKDCFKKTLFPPASDRHVKFITKNNQTHAFIWQTNPEQLQTAVRWGIIQTQSITGKVISSLGKYRLVAHQRAAKGMISNSHAMKMKLLDVFQDRFAALQELESLVNKENNQATYELKITSYITKLQKIQTDQVDSSILDKDTLERIKDDIQSDVDRANSYLNSLYKKDDFRSYNRGRGHHSIMEFVKQQMLYSLYELQGINQDVTYSSKRDFALTRGDLNDFIEDARKVIDDHQADPRNAVTDKHHGIFSTENEENEKFISYDFSEDHLSPSQERDVLLGISFIEGWDNLEQDEENSFCVSNESGREKLDVITATKWKNHRNLTAFFKSIGFFILNIFKGFFVSTRPWEEETWSNDAFHLYATKLQINTTPNEPMWRKPFKLFRQIGYAIIDVVNGVRDFGTNLVINMPDEVVNDWQSIYALPSLGEILTEAEQELSALSEIEKNRLSEILKQCHYEPTLSKQTSTLACAEYALTTGEQNDILTSMARGINEFGAVFSHNLFAKDPIAGVVFTAGLALGAGAIYMPTATASVFGSGYVNWFSAFSYSMGSSKMAAAIGGGSTQAQLFATGFDAMLHGPNGIALNALYQFGEDPLTVGAYLATAYGLGYFLVNGVAGHPIPWLSELLKEDLGSSPETGYPFIGAKVAIMLYEGLITHKEGHVPHPELSELFQKLAESIQSIDQEKKLIIKQSILISWLSKNAATLPKLKSKQLFVLSRHIEDLFSKEQSNSLKKLLYPETHPSIAFQLFSIPLNYIPAVLRFAVSLLLTLYAVGSNQENPFEPIRRASTDLFDKIKKDLSRLIVLTSYLIYIPYTLVSTYAKTASFTASMIIGRVASLFDAKPAHFIHKGFASVHAFFRWLGEFIYPARALKDVTVAHPTHTIKEIENSYERLLVQMRDSKPASDALLSSSTHSNPNAHQLLRKPDNQGVSSRGKRMFCSNKIQ